MTVVADNKKRVTLRLAKPGDRFDVQISPGGKFNLLDVNVLLAAIWSNHPH